MKLYVKMHKSFIITLLFDMKANMSSKDLHENVTILGNLSAQPSKTLETWITKFKKYREEIQDYKSFI
jgi:hypothetical protein